MRNDIVDKIIVALVSAAIIGALYFYIDTKIELNNQNIKIEKIDNNTKNDSIHFTKLELKMLELDTINQNQHIILIESTEKMAEGLRDLTYAINKNDQNMKKTLKEIKEIRQFDYAVNP